MSQTIAVVAAAGLGLRAGREIPKQFAHIGGRPMLCWSVDAFRRHSGIDHILVATSPPERTRTEALFADFDDVEVIDGGATRSETVRASLLAAARTNPPKHILIHDAARPGLSAAVIDGLLDALKTHHAAAPALAMTDAVKRARADGSLDEVERSDLYRIQTPQAFRFDTILAAHNAGQGDAVDDLVVAQAHGVSAKLTLGDPRLMKVTYEEDFALAEKILSSRAVAPRMGSGYDVHAFEPGDGVQLCGVKIPHPHQLKGHSDADVGWHALTDALLGALAAGDIGDHFPPGDPQWKGAPSSTFLGFARDLVAERGYQIANVDLTLICEAPRIGPHREAMRRATADLLTLDVDAVSIKATTTEKLGFLGRGEGIAAQAAAMLAPAGAYGDDA